MHAADFLFNYVKIVGTEELRISLNTREKTYFLNHEQSTIL